METVQEFQRIRKAFSKDQRGFECEKILGEGKYGKVIKATCRKHDDPSQGRAFAIKMMPYVEGDKKRVKYQDRELRLLVLLDNLSDNANVTKYFGSWIMSFMAPTKLLCIQMELCSVSLQKFMSKNEFGGPQIIQAEGPPRFYQQIFRQILNGLIVIHNLIRWIHRDIHPGNILIKNPNPTNINDITVKIADFGRARPKEFGVQLKTSADGTIKPEFDYLTPNSKDGIYMAPELKGKAYGFKVDVYSAGVVLYLICRDLSRDTSGIESEVDSLKQGQLDVKQFIHHNDDDKLIFLIKNLVQENPKLRFSAREAMDHMFSTCTDDVVMKETMSDSEETDSGEASETQFLARKENEQDFRVCVLNQFTFAAFSAEVKLRTRVTAGRHIFRQERMNCGKKRLVIIEDNEDVDRIFRDAKRKGIEVEVVVIKQPEQGENIETESVVAETSFGESL